MFLDINRIALFSRSLDLSWGYCFPCQMNSWQPIFGAWRKDLVKGMVIGRMKWSRETKVCLLCRLVKVWLDVSWVLCFAVFSQSAVMMREWCARVEFCRIKGCISGTCTTSQLEVSTPWKVPCLRWMCHFWMDRFKRRAWFSLGRRRALQMCHLRIV